jgi:hypothetical protein
MHKIYACTLLCKLNLSVDIIIMMLHDTDCSKLLFLYVYSKYETFGVIYEIDLENFNPKKNFF